jgi:DNA-binding GntR family transcriptional regulator
MPFNRHPAYDQIAAELRRSILAGAYEPSDQDPGRHQLPGAAELGTQYGVSAKTAARAVQQLVTEGFVEARPGLRPVVIPRVARPERWPMNRRYARARDTGGLVFGSDMQGRDVDKRTRSTGWIDAPLPVAALLAIQPGEQVWARHREMLIDKQVAELSVSYFPADLARNAPELMSLGAFPSGGVVKILEAAGHTITRTENEVRARLATTDELDRFGPDEALSPAHGRIVIEVTHATYDQNDNPVEAVVSVRPADNNVVSFQTYEAD